MKTNKDDLITLDKYVAKLDDAFKEVKKNVEYLHLTDKQQDNIKEAFKILKTKIKKMKNSETIVQLSEHVRVKKVLKDRGDEE